MADGVRRIARAYYDRSSEDVKDEAKKFFRKLDLNGDRKISLEEFEKGVSSRLSDERVFKELDSNSDGALDFDDVLVLFYYYKNAIPICRCDDCHKLIFGPYFSCFQCLCNGFPETYDLCFDCYEGGKFEHEHPASNLLHDQALLVKFSQLSTNDLKSGSKKEMEELREIARSHYRAGSREVQALARDFFKSMDTNGDGQVDLLEFFSFMKQQGYAQMCNRHFFKELDKDGNGRLDFWEVMMLYYIIKSGRPFCDWCGDFIPGVFFACVECFNIPGNSFYLCRRCYLDNKCEHNHGGRIQFLDNYTLLQAKQDPAASRQSAADHHDITQPPATSASGSSKSACAERDSAPRYADNDEFARVLAQISQSRPTISSAIVAGTTAPTFCNACYVNPLGPSPNYSNAIVPASANMKSWKRSFTHHKMANLQPGDRKIQKVPLLLRGVEHNRDDYDPKAVSFGPYHHGKPELQLCQNAKMLTLQMFVDGSGHSQEFFKREVIKVIEECRRCYVEGSTDRFNDEKFAEMMLLDASFLIYYMNIVDERNHWHQVHIDNYLGRLVWIMVNRDMFLLENQIPFRVVMLLINLRYDKKKGEEAVSKFLHESIWGQYKQPELGQHIREQLIVDIHQEHLIRNIHLEHPPLHILEAYRRVLVWDLIQTRQANSDSPEDSDSRKLRKTFRSAMDLKAKGIYFKPSEKKSLESIKFNSFSFYGQLELPIWFVSGLSKVFFLNMIAYELCPNNGIVETTVISYLTFMKSLIENAADVKELREKKILLTTLGSDEDVVRLYRELDTFEMEDIHSFQEVKHRIQEHYDSKAKTLKAELIHTYLSNPWSIIAWVAGLLLLILTFLQTYFTISK